MNLKVFFCMAIKPTKILERVSDLCLFFVIVSSGDTCPNFFLYYFLKSAGFKCTSYDGICLKLNVSISFLSNNI